MRYLLSGVIFFTLTSIAAAQQTGIELQLDARTLELGESLNVQLVCTNTGRPDTPEAVVPDGLKLDLLGATPSQFSRTSIINGRRSDRITYTYSMRLTALKEGAYRLGPISVAAGGSSYQTEAITIVVHKTNETTTVQGDRSLYASIEVSRKTLYVSQSLTATLVFGMRKVEVDGRTYRFNLLRNVLSQRESQFSVFAGGTTTKSEVQLVDSGGRTHAYEVFRVRKTIRADEVGPLLIGPVFLKADYPTRLRSGFFGRIEAARVRRETARADAVTVAVNGPPREGRPADFHGAIGRFSMTVEAKPQRVRLGQPVTLTVKINGAPLEGLAGPALAAQPELASRFDFTTDELVGDMENGHKVFRRAIFPKQAGEQTIPSLSWSYFDPQAEKYVTLTSKEISLTVDPPSASSRTLSLLDANRSPHENTTLTLLTGGISPNYMDADMVLADQSLTLSAPWLASWIAPPLVWLIATLGLRRRERLRRDSGYARRNRASRSAHARIQRALRNGQPPEQLQMLAAALTGFVSDRFNLPPGEVTPRDVQDALEQHGTEPALVEEVAAFLETCDAVRYAPGALPTTTVAQTTDQIRTWIKQIEIVR